MYERALEEIPDGKWDAAHLLLQFVLVSSRPLLVEELAEFLTLDFDTGSTPKVHAGWRPNDPEDAVLSTCPGFLSVIDVNGSRIVQFSHSSVKEFLISSCLADAGGRSSRYHIDITSAHIMVAQACLGVLLSLDGKISRYGARDFPLALTMLLGTAWIMSCPRMYRTISKPLSNFSLVGETHILPSGSPYTI